MDLVTRAEALKMLLSAKGIAPSTTDAGFMDLGSDASLNGYINAAAAAGIINKGTSFNPNGNATRGEAFKIAANAAGLTTATVDTTAGDLNLSDLFGDLTTASTGTTTVSTGTTTVSTGTTSTTTTVAAGDLQIGLNPASPVSTSVPYNGTVTFGKFDLSAASSDVTVNTIKLAREGLGNRADISRVWMEKNGMRVTGRQTLGTDNSVIISFSPALVIKAGSTEGLDLVASLSGSTTGGQHKFTLVSTADVASSAVKIVGTYPVSTATMTTAAYTVTSVLFATGGSAGTYKAGDTNIELAQFKLTNNATDDKQVQFKSVNFRQEGDGDFAKNVGNLALYKNGTKISTAVAINGKEVIFTLADVVEYGRTETYYVRGDILSVDKTTGDTYKLSLRYSDDINIVETNTQFKASITGVATTQYMSNNTVNGGDIIMSRNTTTSSTQTVSPGMNDVVLLSADLRVASAITLQDLTTSMTGPTANLSTAFNTFKLMIGNSVVATYTPDTTNAIVFQGSFNVPATTTVKIVGNLKSNITGGSLGTYKVATVNYASFGRIEYVSNGNVVSSTQFAGSTDGVSSLVGTASLTFTENDGIAAQNLAVGSTDKTVAQFSMRANDVSDITVTKLKLSPAATSTGITTYSNIPTVKLYVDGVLKSTKSMSSGYVDFNDINVTVAKNSAVTVRVAADFSSAIDNGGKIALTILSATNDVTAKDTNSVDVTKTSATNVVGPLYTFVSAGAATLTLNSSTPNANLLVPGVTETELARYTLAATDDDLKLTDLYVTNLGDADLSARVATVGLYDISGVKLAGGSVLGTGTVQFSLGNSSSFVIAKNTSNTVAIVKAAFNTITDAAQTNKSVRLAVGTGSATPVSGTTNGVRFVSASTGNNVTSVTSTAAVANTGTLLHTKATVATSGAAALTTHTFTVTADAAGRLTMSGITIDLQNPTASTGTYTLYRDQEVAGNVIATGAVAVGSNTLAIGGLNVEVSAGTTKTFILKVAGGLLNATANQKRIAKVTDISFVDNTDTGTAPTITSIAAYSNVGLPTVESTFTY